MLEFKVTKTKPFVCQHCGHGYTRESTMVSHMCEPKRRHLARDEKHVRIGFDAFNRFYKLSQNFDGDKTYKDFANSPYYNAFVKFGSYISNVNPLYPDKYIDFVLKSGAKLDNWCKDSLYEKFVIDLLYREPVEVALQRTIETMQQWANLHNSQWNHYFNYAATSKIFFDIKDGKISPWLLLASKTGKEVLTKFDDKQLEALSPMINPQKWIKIFKSKQQDYNLVKDVVKEGNL